MANRLLIGSTLPSGPTVGVQPLGGPGNSVVGSVVIQVSASAGGFSSIPRIALDGLAVAITGQNAAYTNVLTNAAVAAGTPITADGIYAVFAPGSVAELITSAGTATVDVNVVYGRV